MFSVRWSKLPIGTDTLMCVNVQCAYGLIISFMHAHIHSPGMAEHP